MKKFTVLLSLLAAGGILIGIYFSPSPTLSSTVSQEVAGETGVSDKGFYTYWAEIKKDRNGEIPSGLHAQWAQHDKQKENSRQRNSSRGGGSGFSCGTSTVAENIAFIGPEGHDYGGRTRALLIDSNNPNRIFAGGVSGGMWRSDDGGSSWSALNDQAENLNVSCITQSPFDHNIIYYGTGEPIGSAGSIQGIGVYKSTNGGNSFSLLPATAYQQEANNCVAAGQTAADVEDLSQSWSIAHSKSDQHTVYLATTLGGLYRSQNAGDCWEQVDASYIQDVVTFPNGEVWIAASNQGILRSPNGNSGTFSLISSLPYPSSWARLRLAVCANDPSIVYAGFAYYASGTVVRPDVYRTDDAGLTWTLLADPIDDPFQTGNTQGAYCFNLDVHPADCDMVVVGGVSLMSSQDGGQTWTGLDGSNHADQHAFAAVPGNQTHFYAANDGGISILEWCDYYENFPFLPFSDCDPIVLPNSTYKTIQFYDGDFGPTGDLCIGGTQDNGTFRMENGGSDRVGCCDGLQCHISQQNPDLAYRTTQQNALNRTTDFSSANPSWTSNLLTSAIISEGIGFGAEGEINYADGNQLYIKTGKGVWRTTDAGDNWTRLNGPDHRGIRAMGISSENDPVLFYGGKYSAYSGGMYIGYPLFIRVDQAATAANGSEVDLSSSMPDAGSGDYPHTLRAIAVHPDDNNVLYAGFANYGSGPRIYKVTNAGTTDPVNSPPVWTPIQGDLPDNLPVNTIAVDPDAPDNIIFAGTDYGLYFTVDGGQTWQKESGIPNVIVMKLRMRNSDRSLFIFTHGRGAWKLDLCDAGNANISGTILNESGVGVNLANVDISPNGCNVITGLDGTYQCQPIGGQVYTITPEKNINYMNGVSTYDLVLISKHILGIDPLPTPYKIIGADVNNSNSVTTYDMTLIRALILFINEDLPAGSWKFVDASFTFPNPANPFQTSYPTNIITPILTGPLSGLDFVGIKMGDMNDSHDPAFRYMRSDHQTSLRITDKTLAAGEIMNIPVWVSDFQDKASYELGMRLDTDALELLDVKAGDLGGFTLDNFNLTQKSAGELTALWWDEKGRGLSLNDGQSLFVLKVKAKKDLNSLTGLISLDPGIHRPLAFEPGGAIAVMDLAVEAKKAGLASAARTFNTPNPFSDFTELRFHTPWAMELNISIFDAAGRTVASYPFSATKGENRFSLTSTSDLPAGLLIYQIKGNGFQTSGRMLKQ